MTCESQRQEIQELAYAKWEQAGWPEGDGVDFWLEAERDILSQQPCGEASEVKPKRGSIKASLVAADPPPLKVTKVAGTSRKRAS